MQNNVIKLHWIYDGERPGKKLKHTLPVRFEFVLSNQS